MLRFITYNCYNIKSSLQDIYELCKICDVIFLQETWLFDFELSMLSNIHFAFEGVGTSAIDLSSGLFPGRPHGGIAILLSKSIRDKSHIHFHDDCRLLGVTININTCPCYFLNVYLPYQCDDNYDVFVEYIGKLSALIDEVSTSNLILLDDFNAAVNTTFESELVDLCTSYKLIISDYITYG